MRIIAKLVFLCGIVFMAASAFLLFQGSAPKRSLEMPVRTDATPGRFLETRAIGIRAKPMQEFIYQPSNEATRMSTLQSVFYDFGKRTWFQYSPEGTDPRPAIILFHGGDRNGLSMIDMWKEVARQNSLVLIAPNSKGRTWDLIDPDPKFIHLLIEKANKISPIDFDILPRLN